MKEDFLNELTRAEDIILGSVGIDGEAKIIDVELRSTGYAGVARWPDGETSPFAMEEELTDLEKWALEVWRARGAAH